MYCRPELVPVEKETEVIFRFVVTHYLCKSVAVLADYYFLNSGTKLVKITYSRKSMVYFIYFNKTASDKGLTNSGVECR